jgi:hypothetical protein
MCGWGTSEPVEVTVPASISRTGAERRKVVDVDACLAPLVKTLNDAGYVTVASCCGHGKRPGDIILADGRELHIMPDFATSRRADRLYDALGFQPINPWSRRYRMRTLPLRLAIRLLGVLVTRLARV